MPAKCRLFVECLCSHSDRAVAWNMPASAARSPPITPLPTASSALRLAASVPPHCGSREAVAAPAHPPWPAARDGKQLSLASRGFGDSITQQDQPATSGAGACTAAVARCRCAVASDPGGVVSPPITAGGRGVRGRAPRARRPPCAPRKPRTSTWAARWRSPRRRWRRRGFVARPASVEHRMHFPAVLRQLLALVESALLRRQRGQLRGRQDAAGARIRRWRRL
jgi:hypothetical protein